MVANKRPDIRKGRQEKIYLSHKNVSEKEKIIPVLKKFDRRYKKRRVFVEELKKIKEDL